MNADKHSPASGVRSTKRWVRDFSLFGRIVNTLKRHAWFMDNVSVWRLCDSDDSDSPDDFNEEDLLIHYQEKTAMRA